MFSKLKKFLPVVNNAVAVADEVVHAEFHSASLVLEEESRRLVDECSRTILEESNADIVALGNLGFSNSASLKPALSQISKAAAAKEKLALISKWKEKYPLYKFITKACAESICEKYNLYIADADKFIGFIPTKNQKEILNFRIEEKDISQDVGGLDWRFFRNMPMEDLYFRNVIDRPEHTESEIKSKPKVQGRNLRIIAPKDQLDITKADKIRGRFITTDPVVLQPVEGGYLIVTAWGKEANDTSIQNEALN